MEQLLIFLLCLFPLAIYFLILAILNRRDHPVAVSGTWDFAGVLLAASGFLLLGGPLLLRTLCDHWRVAAMTDGRLRLDDVEGILVFAVFLMYFLGVVIGAVYLLRGRRDSIAVY